MVNECKQRYLRIADRDAETRLDKLLHFLEQNEFGFYEMGEKSEGSQKYVRVTVDIKVTANQRKQ